MATALDRILLANKDHDVLLALVGHYQKYPEWIVTVAFYKALHLVDAVCLESGFVPSGHAHRLELLKRRPAWQPIHRHYRPLWIASGIARYLYDHEAKQNYGTFTDFMPVEDVERTPLASGCWESNRRFSRRLSLRRSSKSSNSWTLRSCQRFLLSLVPSRSSLCYAALREQASRPLPGLRH
jgi:hypothetical protein